MAKKSKKKIIIIIIAVVFLLGIIGAMGGGDDESVAEQLTGFEGKELAELMSVADELGYSATYYVQGEDWTEIIPLDDTWKQELIVDSVIEDAETKTFEANLVFKADLEREDLSIALEEKLTKASAWIAAEEYGQDLYGKDFEINYIMGEINSEPEDENTWFLKATGELLGQEVTCEATVTGTTENPEVVSLNVY